LSVLLILFLVRPLALILFLSKKMFEDIKRGKLEAVI
jgi:hypothetical protein